MNNNDQLLTDLRARADETFALRDGTRVRLGAATLAQLKELHDMATESAQQHLDQAAEISGDTVKPRVEDFIRAVRSERS
jgi:hypothetical protein